MSEKKYKILSGTEKASRESPNIFLCERTEYKVKLEVAIFIKAHNRVQLCNSLLQDAAAAV